jgi:hypothetical protein
MYSVGLRLVLFQISKQMEKENIIIPSLLIFDSVMSRIQADVRSGMDVSTWN